MQPRVIRNVLAPAMDCEFSQMPILLLFRGEKVSRFDVFLSLPEKLLRLPVTLPILGTLDSDIHGKTFAVTKRSAKTAKLFHSKTKAIYGISPLISTTGINRRLDHVKCVEVLVHRSSPVRKLASTICTYIYSYACSCTDV